MKQDMGPVPGDFLQSLASGSLVEPWEAWETFDRLSPPEVDVALQLWRWGRGIGEGSGLFASG